MQASLGSDGQPQACHGPCRLAMARYRWAREMGGDTLGESDMRLLDVPPLAADDSAFFVELEPALVRKLGVRAGEARPRSHSTDFDADERAIGIGAAITRGIRPRLLTRATESWVQA